MNAASQKRLTKVHPLLAEQIRKLAQNLFTHNIDIEVVQGLRTFAEQDALYAQGRAKPGQRVTNARGGSSNHNYGVAVDVAPTKNGKIDWNDLSAFVVIGREAKKLGLKWGGDWKKFVDKPHIEMPSPDIKTMRKLYDKGGLPEVWKSVNSAKPLPVVDAIQNDVVFSDVEEVTDEIKTNTEADAAKGVTTGGAKTEESGTPPPAPAVDVKASRPSIKSTAVAIFTFLMAPLSYVGIDAKQVGEFAKGNLTLAIKVGAALAMVIIAVYVWNRAMDRAQERTNRLMDAASDKTRNNLRLVKDPTEEVKAG